MKGFDKTFPDDPLVSRLDNTDGSALPWTTFENSHAEHGVTYRYINYNEIQMITTRF